ncbi:17676_t:CDS:1, partial [Racocetra persica]
NHLYRKNKVNDGPPLRVIQDDELEEILYGIYSDMMAEYFGIKSIYNR